MHGDCGLENMEKALEKNVFSHVLLFIFFTIYFHFVVLLVYLSHMYIMENF